jgi:hypothetical protein
MDIIRLTVELSELMIPGCPLPAPNIRVAAGIHDFCVVFLNYEFFFRFFPQLRFV